MSQNIYYYYETGKALRNVIVTAAFGMFLMPFLMGTVWFVALEPRPVVGVLSAIGAIAFLIGFGMRAASLIRNDKWEMGVDDDAIWWRSPRWPKSNGTIAAKEIATFTIYSHDRKALVETRAGESIDIPFSGPAEDVKDVVEKSFPEVRTKWVDTF